MRNLQVHFTYNVNGTEVQDLCVVQSKSKRFAMGLQMLTQFKLAKQLDLKAEDITLTHYYVC